MLKQGQGPHTARLQGAPFLLYSTGMEPLKWFSAQPEQQYLATIGRSEQGRQHEASFKQTPADAWVLWLFLGDGKQRGLVWTSLN